jgi:hypothetical protein
MENTTTETQVAAPAKTLFQLLEEANNQNISRREPTLLGTSQEFLTNSLSIVTGTVESIAKGMELANSYISEELDRQVGSRTEAKVDVVIQQLTAISRLTALGANVGDATALATSYRR